MHFVERGGGGGKPDIAAWRAVGICIWRWSGDRRLLILSMYRRGGTLSSGVSPSSGTGENRQTGHGGDSRARDSVYAPPIFPSQTPNVFFFVCVSLHQRRCCQCWLPALMLLSDSQPPHTPPPPRGESETCLGNPEGVEYGVKYLRSVLPLGFPRGEIFAG